PSVLRLITQQDYINEDGHQNVNGGKDGVSDGFVGAGSVGLFVAEDEESNDGEDVEDEHGEDDVIEKLAVAATDAKDAAPDALHEQRGGGGFVLGMELSGGLEEETVFGHGVVDAGAGEDQAVVAAEGGDEDEDRHDGGAGRSEDLLHDGGGDAVLRGVLNAAGEERGAVGVSGHGEHEEVNEIRETVERDDDAGAECEGEWEIALRVADF